MRASCNLSHDPTNHNTPVCLHYMTKKGCTNAGCKYMHIAVEDMRAPICVAFAREGYCPKLGCKERHLWQCPDVDAGKVCSKGHKCKLAPCILERKGIDVSKLYVKRNMESELAVVLEEEDTVTLNKPDFVSGFNPRGSTTYDPNELAVDYHESSSEDEQSDEEEVDDEMEGNDNHEDDGGEVTGNNEFGDDVIDLDWGDEKE
ncbi:UNVERIFIED_CONTAM: hypothetical protein HDU68_007158 [Siphonaria sp. JEL0065]|nr:hypothetical protein HDU68_007158 [Siphonaria sp. JEL0065]